MFQMVIVSCVLKCYLRRQSLKYSSHRTLHIIFTWILKLFQRWLNQNLHNSLQHGIGNENTYRRCVVVLNFEWAFGARILFPIPSWKRCPGDLENTLQKNQLDFDHNHTPESEIVHLCLYVHHPVCSINQIHAHKS